MSHSFYITRKYGVLRTASQAFSDLINSAAESYGLTVLQAADYRALNDDYAEKFQISVAPETRTVGTIRARTDAARLLKARAAQLAKIIAGTPTVTSQQKIGLGLAVRATPSPAPPPGTCSDFKVMLRADGSVQLTWRANNPTRMTGVTYQIWRRFGSAGAFSFAGASGEKKFIDSTIPAGTPQVQYQVRGIRSTGAGAWAQHNVNFGQPAIAANSTPPAAVGAKPAPKLAA
jgi:hypothetical protein